MEDGGCRPRRGAAKTLRPLSRMYHAPIPSKEGDPILSTPTHVTEDASSTTTLMPNGIPREEGNGESRSADLRLAWR